MPERAERLRVEALRWLRLAREDFRTARNVVASASLALEEIVGPYPSPDPDGPTESP